MIWGIIYFVLWAFALAIVGLLLVVLYLLVKFAMTYDPYGDRKPNKRDKKK
ncbi:MAG: hypothetical protein [Caudoviricetes sp.]|nr:MAG: hypothetical protein [Caudoviricetes sp.]